MRNFNTNQTRHFYVAEAIASGTDVSSNLDIKMKSLATGEIFFSYKNADGIVVRSDTIDPKKIASLKKAYATASGSVPGMDIPLKKHTITINTVNYASYTNLKGKKIKLTITVHQAFDYDDGNTRPFVVYYNVPANLASAQALYEALDAEIDKVLPAQYATVTSGAGGLVLTEKVGKFVRGKLTGEPCPLSIAFGIIGDDEPLWGVDTVSNSSSVYPSYYTIADLEFFSYGERGDMYRGFNYPNDYNTKYSVVTDGTKNYDMISIEYYWAGDAENVQKSPRLIEIAMPHAVSDNPIDALYDLVAAAMNNGGSGSGTGA